MVNVFILSPSIYFLENHDEFLKHIFSKEKAFQDGNALISHFTINKKEYSFCLNFKVIPEIVFVKKFVNENSLNNIKDTDIIFKTLYKTKTKTKETNPDVLKMEEEIFEAYKPSYNTSLRCLAPVYFSTFEDESFKDFCQLLDGISDNELYSIYQKERTSVIDTLTFLINDLFDTFEKNEELNNKKNIECFLEERVFYKNNNLLISYSDSYITVIEKNNTSINIYEIDKDEYKNTLTEEEYEDPNTLFYDQDDCLKRIDEIKLTLNSFKVAEISNDYSLVDTQFIYFLTHRIFDTNKNLFSNYNVIKENNKIQPNDLMFTTHELLSSTDYYWFNGSLYNPNNIKGINYEHLTRFIKEPTSKYLIISSSELMLSYTKYINKDWSIAINEAIDKADDIILIHKDNSNTFNLAKTNLNKIKKYRDKHIGLKG
jgi:hypothetical protein